MASPSAPPPKKAKVENRQFNESWKLEFFFTMPDQRPTVSANAKPVCIICGKTVSCLRKHDLKRHHETKHKEFSTKFRLGSDDRKRKLTSLLRGYTQSSRLIKKKKIVKKFGCENWMNFAPFRIWAPSETQKNQRGRGTPPPPGWRSLAHYVNRISPCDASAHLIEEAWSTEFIWSTQFLVVCQNWWIQWGGFVVIADIDT